ncbi:MAG: hypothetical protein Q4B60_07535 [Erysipelotrichaceae bacterium]|nr:hypothetical protein [Erysipelotrichaceae bacterium]
MGSGYNSSYSNTNASQAYSDNYSVMFDMRENDTKIPGVYSEDIGYIKNPTAKNLLDSIVENRVYIDGKIANGKIMYVLDPDDNIVIAIRKNVLGEKKSPHPTLIGGKNPLVKCAGMMTFNNGKIVSVDNMSGHYKPNLKSLSSVKDKLEAISQDNIKIFSIDSEWSNKS